MIKNCKFCLKEFKTRNWRRKFCSHVCYSTSIRGIPHTRNIDGENNPNWSGGKRIDKDGYVLIHTPYHPYCDVNGYVREHRLVIEKKEKRFLLNGEIVHHKNGNVQDNRFENLEILDKKQHDRLHALERRAKGFKIENYARNSNLKKAKGVV